MSRQHLPGNRNEQVGTEAFDRLQFNIDDHEPRKDTSKWCTGWVTPTLIALFYIAGLVSAAGHYFFFRYLNEREADISSQSWVSNISIAFVRVFSISLGSTLGIAYTQLLWRRLRGTPLKVSTIDSLFQISSNPLKLLDTSGITKAPILWLTAAFLPCVPIATIFPPGALIIYQPAITANSSMSVPWYDFDYRGNDSSYQSLAAHALFTLGSDGELRYAKPYLSRVAKRSIMSGSFLPSPSPCGANCSYTVTFLGPSFSCQDQISSDLPQLVAQNYGNVSSNGRARSEFNPAYIQYIAAQNYTAALNGNFTFEVQWNNHSSLSCTTWYSEYTLSISYSNFVQSVAVHVLKQQPLNGTYLAANALFYKDGSWYPNDWVLMSGVNVSTAYRESNVRAVMQSLVDTMSGAVSEYGSENQFIANTIVLETPLASFDPAESRSVHINLSAEVLQGLLQNITISLLTLANANLITEVTTKDYVTKYQFAFQEKLIVPYASALTISFVIVVLGLRALVKNGVSANGAGFLQLLCTTKGSKTVDEAAWAGSLGGNENVPKELEDLVVRFGELRDRVGVRAGFGVADEVRKLVKGRNYG
ncbi:hypothetical protein FOXYSP1_19749 [Fusarium oxysporum f. sp. phaseoli]